MTGRGRAELGSWTPPLPQGCDLPPPPHLANRCQNVTVSTAWGPVPAPPHTSCVARPSGRTPPSPHSISGKTGTWGAHSHRAFVWADEKMHINKDTERFSYTCILVASQRGQLLIRSLTPHPRPPLPRPPIYHPHHPSIPHPSICSRDSHRVPRVSLALWDARNTAVTKQTSLSPWGLRSPGGRATARELTEPHVSQCRGQLTVQIGSLGVKT